MILIADSGIPMLGVIWPLGWLAFIPVVLIESLVAIKSLRLGFRRSLVVTAAANAVSTLVGIPVAWIACVLLELVTGGGRFLPVDTPFQRFLAVFRSAAWLPPYRHDLAWMIPAAAIVLCVPLYVASVIIENAITRRMVENSRQEVWRFSRLANLASYSLILLFWIGILIWSLCDRQ